MRPPFRARNVTKNRTYPITHGVYSFEMFRGPRDPFRLRPIADWFVAAYPFAEYRLSPPSDFAETGVVLSVMRVVKCPQAWKWAQVRGGGDLGRRR